MFKRSVLTVLSLLVLSVPLKAAENTFQIETIQITGEPSQYTDLKNLADASLQTMRDSALFFQRLGIDGETPANLSIKTFSAYGDFKKTLSKNHSESVNVFGSYGEQKIQLWVGTAEKMRLIRHETLHHVLENCLPGIPVWLNESTAELFSREEAFLSQATVKNFPRVLKDVLLGAQATKHFSSYGDIFRLSREEFYGKDQDIRYAAGAAILAYLAQTQEPRVFGNFFKAVAEGEDAQNWLTQNLNLSTEKLDLEINRWLQGQ